MSVSFAWRKPGALERSLEVSTAEKGVDIEVFMPYAAKMKSVVEWYVQLWLNLLGSVKIVKAMLFIMDVLRFQLLVPLICMLKHNSIRMEKDKVIQFVET